jgi:hypothetical protein
MNRRFPCILAVLAAALLIWPCSAGAAGSVLLESVAPGDFQDPFLAAGEAIVRQQGFRGDFAMLVGLSGLGEETAMCRHDCDCRETMHSAGALRRLVAPLKGSVTRYGAGITAPDAAWEALEAELRAGRPLLAEQLSGPHQLDLVVGCDPATRSVIVAGRGEKSRHSFAAWVKGQWTLAAARLGTTELPDARAEMDAVAAMLARSQQPRIEDGCVAREERTENAKGLEAYQLWAQRLQTDEKVDPAAKGLRLESWTERRELLARFMEKAASHQSGETAKGLRGAAAMVHEELKQGLKPLTKSCPYPPPPGAGQKQADPAVRKKQGALIGKAAACRTGLPQRQAAALGAKVKADPKLLKGMLHSSSATVRTLGALAAARAADAAVVSDLSGNLDSSDAVEARTALSALQTIQPANLDSILEQHAATAQAAAGVAGGMQDGKDGIGPQLQVALSDLKQLPAASGSGANPLAWLTRGPFLIALLSAALLGIALVAWRVAGRYGWPGRSRSRRRRCPRAFRQRRRAWSSSWRSLPRRDSC